MLFVLVSFGFFETLVKKLRDPQEDAPQHRGGLPPAGNPLRAAGCRDFWGVGAVRYRNLHEVGETGYQARCPARLSQDDPAAIPRIFMRGHPVGKGSGGIAAGGFLPEYRGSISGCRRGNFGLALILVHGPRSACQHATRCDVCERYPRVAALVGMC